jgi:hypothetical protein
MIAFMLTEPKAGSLVDSLTPVNPVTKINLYSPGQLNIWQHLLDLLYTFHRAYLMVTWFRIMVTSGTGAIA